MNDRTDLVELWVNHSPIRSPLICNQICWTISLSIRPRSSPSECNGGAGRVLLRGGVTSTSVEQQWCGLARPDYILQLSGPVLACIDGIKRLTFSIVEIFFEIRIYLVKHYASYHIQTLAAVAVCITIFFSTCKICMFESSGYSFISWVGGTQVRSGCALPRRATVCTTLRLRSPLIRTSRHGSKNS